MKSTSHTMRLSLGCACPCFCPCQTPTRHGRSTVTVFIWSAGQGWLSAAAFGGSGPGGGGLECLVEFFGVDAQDSVAEAVAGEFAVGDEAADGGDADVEAVGGVLEGLEAQCTGGGGCSVLGAHACTKTPGTARGHPLLPSAAVWFCETAVRRDCLACRSGRSTRLSSRLTRSSW